MVFDFKDEGIVLEGKIMYPVLQKDSAIKSRLKKRILDLNDGTRFDFTMSYLEDLNIKRLRHILLFAKTMKLKKPCL